VPGRGLHKPHDLTLDPDGLKSLLDREAHLRIQLRNRQRPAFLGFFEKYLEKWLIRHCCSAAVTDVTVAYAFSRFALIFSRGDTPAGIFGSERNVMLYAERICTTMSSYALCIWLICEMG
jgi:hypothetical protein